MYNLCMHPGIKRHAVTLRQQDEIGQKSRLWVAQAVTSEEHTSKMVLSGLRESSMPYAVKRSYYCIGRVRGNDGREDCCDVHVKRVQLWRNFSRQALITQQRKITTTFSCPTITNNTVRPHVKVGRLVGYLC